MVKDHLNFIIISAN